MGELTRRATSTGLPMLELLSIIEMLVSQQQLLLRRIEVLERTDKPRKVRKLDQARERRRRRAL